MASRRTLIRAAVTLGDYRISGGRDPIGRAAWSPGVSVIIPERSRPDLLARALACLEPALAAVSEATETIVVVNGAPSALYADLRIRWPRVRWIHHDQPLGFTAAISRGLRAARFGAAYLHNSDMALEPDALAVLLPWRAPHVFAVASQIFFDDPTKRREETGWGDLALIDGRLDLFDRTPERDGQVRSGLYAGGGSSLFDLALLRQYAADTLEYDPFYWEDVDWGLRAWRSGLEVLFHPGSVAYHRHRATIGRFFSPDQIEQVIARNRELFRGRNLLDGPEACRALASGDWETMRARSRPRALDALRRVRRARARSAFAELSPENRTRHVHARPRRADRPLVMVVSPYRVLPPRHGGAQRIWRLCDALQDRYRFMLLSDEGAAHGAAALRRLGPFDSVCLVEGRPDAGDGRIERVRSHSHSGLQTELSRLAEIYRPDIIHVEHVELSALNPPPGIPSVLTAHDVLISGEVEADRFEMDRMRRFSRLIVTSAEDAALLQPSDAAVVPNGATPRGRYRPSAGSSLLFAGPFRYAPNLVGLRQFLAKVYPRLRAGRPDLSLVILGGERARAHATGDPLFGQPGVIVQDAVDNVRPWLDRCVLSLNPLNAVRGSSLKLIESVTAGRICVSTLDGARGFLSPVPAGLVIAPTIAAMLGPIAHLLDNPARRHALELPDKETLLRHSWTQAAGRQAQVYEALLRPAEAK